MSKNYDYLSDVQIDVLRELGNIGAGNAATSLSLMLGQQVNMSIPKVKLVEFDQVAQEVGGPEKQTYGVLLHLQGQVEGMILFILNEEFAGMVLDALMGEHFKQLDELDDMAYSAIKELGNILSSSFVKSISELTGLEIGLSVPSVTIDMAGALLSVPIIKFGTVGDKVLYVEETFSSGDLERVVSHMIMFAEMDSLNMMLEKLGLV